MAKNLNRVELIGNVTADPEMKYTPNGIAVTSFTVATNRSWQTDGGEKKEQADFHRCVSWNKLAELSTQLLVKGSKVFIEGRLQNREWEKDGIKKTATEIILTDFILLEKANGQEIQSNTKEESESF